MPDISMCNGSGCDRKADCYRYRAVPSEFRQAYAAFDAKMCTDFIPLWPGDHVRELAAGTHEPTGRVVRLPLAKPQVGNV